MHGQPVRELLVVPRPVARGDGSVHDATTMGTDGLERFRPALTDATANRSPRMKARGRSPWRTAPSRTTYPRRRL